MCLAIPGRILALDDGERTLASVEVAGVRRKVDVGLLGAEPGSAGADASDAPKPGDWVLIHVGFAISRIDEREAAETLRWLESLGSAWEEEIEGWSSRTT